MYHVLCMYSVRWRVYAQYSFGEIGDVMQNGLVRLIWS